MRRLLTVLLLAFAAVGLASGPALAHNVLIGSDPEDGATLTASPERVTLVFDQTVRQGYAQMGVTAADGSAWADGAAVVAASRVSVKVKPLPAGGTYVVGYRILSSDGHPVTGKITFHLTADASGTATEPAAGGTPAGDTAGNTTADGNPAVTDATAGDAPAADTRAGDTAVTDTAAGGASAGAAEAAANGGAGMAVLWIVGALLLLAACTVVALRRSSPTPATASGPPDGSATEPGSSATASEEDARAGGGGA